MQPPSCFTDQVHITVNRECDSFLYPSLGAEQNLIENTYQVII